MIHRQSSTVTHAMTATATRSPLLIAMYPQHQM
jgi:hypothetical protein